MKKLLFMTVLGFCGMLIMSNPFDPDTGRIWHDAGRKDNVVSDSFDFFNSDDVLDISLCFDLKKFFNSKKKPEYLDAAILIDKRDMPVVIEDSIKIKARGNMRRMYCRFPPVMLKFKNDSSGIFYEGKLKMVIPCVNSAKYENYLLREYLIYRLYNIVSPYSLKTRLIRITLTDSKSTSRSYSFYAFLIENEKNLAHRTNSVVLNHSNLGQRNMDAGLMVRVALFNYMIGNTDWSVPTQHNIKILKSNKITSESGIPVMYDFDYAGLVSPPYAAPAKDLPITEVKERYYLGLCAQNEELEYAISDFELIKDEILGTVSDFEYLSRYDRKITESYLNSFYKMTRNKSAMIKMLTSTCK
jgi:hypothetical protein